MATVLGRITVNSVEICEVDGDPTGGGGTSGPVGTLALDSATGNVYTKTGALDTDWSEVGSSGPTAASQNFLVYRPGVATSGNVFGTWGDLMTQVASVDGPVTVHIDDDVTSPAPVPAGTHTFPFGAKFQGQSPTVSSRAVAVEFADGAEIVGVWGFETSLQLVSVSTSPVMTVPPDAVLVMRDDVHVRADGTAAFFEVADASSHILGLFSATFEAGASPVVSVTAAGAFVGITGFDQAIVADDVVSSVAGSTVFLGLSTPDSPVSFTQSGVAGTLTTALSSLGERVQYDDGAVAPPIVGGTASNVQAAIDALKTTGAGPTFVFQPGGAPGANVFTSWTALMSALTAVSGPKWVEMDDRFAAITIPGGGPYDMRDTTVRGRLLSGTPTIVTVASGAVFENLERLEWCRFDWAGAAPAMVVPAGLSYFRLWGAAVNRTGGTAPFFDVTTAGAVLLTQFENASGFNPLGSGLPVVDLGGTGAMSFALDEGSNNGVDTVSGTPGSSVTVAIRDPSARFDPIVGPTFTGAVSGPTLVGIAVNLGYDDAVVAPPIVGGGSSDVQAAIDALKGRVPLTDSVVTGDATPTPVLTIPTAADAALNVRVQVVGRTAAGVSASYVRTAHVEVSGGAPTVSVVSTDFTFEDDPAWDATITVSGGALVVEVTGVAATSITWSATAEVVEVT